MVKKKKDSLMGLAKGTVVIGVVGVSAEREPQAWY